jgi:hypothetical protein
MKMFEHAGQVIVIDKIEAISRVKGDDFSREFVITTISGKEYTFGVSLGEDEERSLKKEFLELEALRNSLIRMIDQS